MNENIRLDKNHNPRKGTETTDGFRLMSSGSTDKNHNPRKGTDKKSSLIFVFSFFVENFDKLGCFLWLIMYKKKLSYLS